MSGVVSFLVFAAFFIVMMRLGCGACGERWLHGRRSEPVPVNRHWKRNILEE
jgi:hypothetical protein